MMMSVEMVEIRTVVDESKNITVDSKFELTAVHYLRD